MNTWITFIMKLTCNMKTQNTDKMLITTVCGWHTTYILSGKLRNQITMQKHITYTCTFKGIKFGLQMQYRRYLKVCIVINILVHYNTCKCSVWHYQNYITLTDPVTHKWKINLQTCHSCRVHCKPYQHAPIYNLPRDRRVGRPLSQNFKRPRITQTSTITKNMENQTKKPKMLQIIKAEVRNTCLKHIHINWCKQCSYFTVVMLL